MSSRAPGLFDRFTFPTDREIFGSQTLSVDQTRSIKNIRATIAEEKVLLAYDPEKPEEFKFLHEYLRGQIEILNYILDLAEGAAENLIAMTKDSSTSNQTEG